MLRGHEDGSRQRDGVKEGQREPSVLDNSRIVALILNLEWK